MSERNFPTWLLFFFFPQNDKVHVKNLNSTIIFTQDLAGYIIQKKNAGYITWFSYFPDG